MTVLELMNFLRDFDDDCMVKMLQCADDNPLTDDVPVCDTIAIESAKGETYIVIIPQ